MKTAASFLMAIAMEISCTMFNYIYFVNGQGPQGAVLHHYNQLVINFKEMWLVSSVWSIDFSVYVKQLADPCVTSLDGRTESKKHKLAIGRFFLKAQIIVLKHQKQWKQ